MWQTLEQWWATISWVSAFQTAILWKWRTSHGRHCFKTICNESMLKSCWFSVPDIEHCSYVLQENQVDSFDWVPEDRCCQGRLPQCSLTAFPEHLWLPIPFLSVQFACGIAVMLWLTKRLNPHWLSLENSVAALCCKISKVSWTKKLIENQGSIKMTPALWNWWWMAKSVQAKGPTISTFS